jgi:hypothetical protein
VKIELVLFTLAGMNVSSVHSPRLVAVPAYVHEYNSCQYRFTGAVQVRREEQRTATSASCLACKAQRLNTSCRSPVCSDANQQCAAHDIILSPWYTSSNLLVTCSSVAVLPAASMNRSDSACCARAVAKIEAAMRLSDHSNKHMRAATS